MLDVRPRWTGQVRLDGVTLRIVSESREQRLELDTNEYTDHVYPSISVVASVTDGAFSGANPSVWIAVESLDSFLSELRSLERTRRGSARLEGMSPKELDLVIESVDGAGHCHLRYTISRMTFTAAGTSVHSVSGSFDLDSELLVSLLTDFVAWASCSTRK